MKTLLCTDLHAYPHKRKYERLEDCLKCLNWVFDVAAERDIKNIIFGGDLFHDRQKIDILTYQKVFETLQNRLKSNQFNLYLLLGNHDLWYNDTTTVSSVIPLSALPGVHVVANPSRIVIEGRNWDFIPFTLNPIASVEELKQYENPEFAIGHIALDGALLHGKQYSDVEIEHDGDMVRVSAELFDHYKYTFLGHYHAAQKVNSKVEYIGSPLQLSFGEAFQTKHIIIFDGKNKEYIENTFSPKHLVINVEDRNKHDLTGNFVKIKVNDISATDLVTLRKELSESNVLGSLEIKQEKVKIEESQIKDAKAILYKGDEMLVKYIDEVSTELDKERLLQIGRKICQKTTS